MRKISKLLAVIISVAIIFAALPLGAITASAATSGITGDCTWTLNGTALTISGKGKIGDYSYDAAPWGVKITKVNIGNGVTCIGDYAFYNCTGLTSITIPDSVTSIGRYAFSRCTRLTSVTIGNSVTSIGYCAFERCYNLTSITIPDSVTSIGDFAFLDCTGLTSVTIGNSVTSIGNDAFSGCTGLTSVTIGNSVTSMGRNAFDGCKGLTSVTILDGVTSIGNYAFSGCTGLTSVTIPNSVTSIGENAFYGCTGLTSVTIPDSVTSIGDYAFSGCTGLTSVTIPNSVTSIGMDAFYDCYNLTSVTIGNSVTSIGYEAFFSTAYYNDLSNWTDGVLYINDCLIRAKDDVPENYTVKNGTRLIADEAFFGCDGLTSVTIPNSVKYIDYQAFCGCAGLTSVTIPNSVTSIGDYAFACCTGLTSVTIGNSVTSIGYYAFRDCDNLKTIYYFGTPEKFATLVTEHWNDELLGLDIVYMQQLESNDVELTAECGVLEEGTVFSAEKIDSNLEQIAEQLPEYYDAKSIIVYELSLTKDGEKVEFDGTVTVTVPLPEGMNPNKCRVLYMDDNGNVTDMNAVYKDGAMVFDTTHFSTYILVKDNKVTPGDLDGNSAITDADAVYLLMYTFFPDDYPINQDCDFDGNGAVTDADAVYLLMYTFFPEDYPIA